MKLLERIGFRRMDEMELVIWLNSLRWSSLYSGCALMALTIYEMVSTGKIGWAWYILITQYIVCWIAHYILTRRMRGGGDEK